MKRISYIITLINLAFQVVYSLFGGFTNTETGKLISIFHIFRAEYMVVSGLIAFINIILLACMLIFSKKRTIYNVIMMLLNMEFLIYYIRLIGMQ